MPVAVLGTPRMLDKATAALHAQTPPVFPFAAIVGHQWAKNALLLLAVDPRLGGVLIAAGAGTGKSTLARSFHALLPPILSRTGCALHCDPNAPWSWCTECRAQDGDMTGNWAAPPLVELPLSATEDRLVGGLDLEASLRLGRRVADRGLLALANRGVLQADSINLLEKGLLNLVLEATSRGRVILEREGISRDDPASFMLLGTYDPREGALRAHLADRIGPLVAPQEQPTAAERAEIVRRAEAFRVAPARFVADYAEEMNLLAALLRDARELLPRVVLEDAPAQALAEAASALGVEGNRADLFAARAACAAAALEGRDRVDDGDLRAAVRLVLLPRATQMPPPAAPDQPPPPAKEEGEQEGAAASAPSVEALLLDALEGVELPEDVLVLQSAHTRRGAAGSRGKIESARRGRIIGVAPGDAREGQISISATLRAAAPLQRERGRAPGTRPILTAEDIRLKRFRDKAGTLFIFCVDASGSMALNRMRQAKGAVTHLLGQAYIHRDRVALIAFRGTRAEVLLPPSQGVERAKRSLDVLPTGGGTPLASALLQAHQLAQQAQSAGTTNVLLVCITDGRANIPLEAQPAPRVEVPPTEAPAPDALSRRAQAQEEARKLARRWQAAGRQALVIDTQASYTGRGEARTLAGWFGGRYLYLPGAGARDIAHAASAAAGETRGTTHAR